VSDLASERPPIDIEDLKNIFTSEEPAQPAIQKLRAALDSIVEYDEWEEKNSLAEYYDGEELEDIIIYSASGYLCRRLRKFSKCDVCRQALLTNLETSELGITELVNAKTKGFLLYCNLHLYHLFKQTETHFVKNVSSSDCYERTITDVIQNVHLTFLCDEHKTDIISNAVHYCILMRMR